MKKPVAITIGIAVGVAAVLIIPVIVLGLNGIFQRRASIRRAGAEIRLLSAALEKYKDDHGHYPSDPATTEQLRTNRVSDPAEYEATSAFLYRALWGTDGHAGQDSDRSNSHRYIFEYPRQMLVPDEKGVIHLIDPWGNCYGYSTFKAVHSESPDANNPTFDLWSTGNTTSNSDHARWIKNW